MWIPEILINNSDIGNILKAKGFESDYMRSKYATYYFKEGFVNKTYEEYKHQIEKLSQKLLMLMSIAC